MVFGLISLAGPRFFPPHFGQISLLLSILGLVWSVTIWVASSRWYPQTRGMLTSPPENVIPIRHGVVIALTAGATALAGILSLLLIVAVETAR